MGRERELCAGSQGMSMDDGAGGRVVERDVAESGGFNMMCGSSCFLKRQQAGAAVCGYTYCAAAFDQRWARGKSLLCWHRPDKIRRARSGAAAADSSGGLI